MIDPTWAWLWVWTHGVMTGALCVLTLVVAINFTGGGDPPQGA